MQRRHVRAAPKPGLPDPPPPPPPRSQNSTHQRTIPTSPLHQSPGAIVYVYEVAPGTRGRAASEGRSPADRVSLSTRVSFLRGSTMCSPRLLAKHFDVADALDALHHLLRLGRIHLALHADVVDDGAVTRPQRRDKELVPERRAVLPVVEEADAHVALLLNGVADHLHRALVGARALQEAAVAAEDLIHGVARELREARRCEDDGVVRQRRIRDGEALLRRLQGVNEPVVLLHDVHGGVDGLAVIGIVLQLERVRVDARLGREDGGLRLGAVVEDLVRHGRHLGLHDVAQALVDFTQVVELVLQALEHKLLAQPRPLRVLTVAQAALHAVSGVSGEGLAVAVGRSGARPLPLLPAEA
mmetsp:Transcript_40837/g.127905  ORF Transcript_40837/g.127905 Transcript_40837/m.127905 type:complete len:357 (-) Transcript_40837:397-1467(-)